MKSPYIFLDFDSCLNNTKYYKDHPVTKDASPADQLDPKNLENLNQILQETNAKIIISSSWRRHYSLDQIKDILVNSGLNPSYRDNIVDKNPIMGDKGKEIEASLEQYKDDVGNFSVIDNAKNELKKYVGRELVKINGKKGLTKKKSQKVIDKLKGLDKAVGSIQNLPAAELHNSQTKEKVATV